MGLAASELAEPHDGAALLANNFWRNALQEDVEPSGIAIPATRSGPFARRSGRPRAVTHGVAKGFEAVDARKGGRIPAAVGMRWNSSGETCLVDRTWSAEPGGVWKPRAS
ncbi:MAG TPA: hypothetical protein VKV36_03750 [Acidimicrobiales bacterium]|nr:hypothetical protein [Acidimicrobiales bacterium]